jgi:hypothetical protein
MAVEPGIFVVQGEHPVGAGMVDPVAMGDYAGSKDTEEGRACNRRVELVLAGANAQVGKK